MGFLVQGLGYLSVGVRNLDHAAREAETFGARVSEKSDGRIIMSSNGRRAELVLNATGQNGLCAVGLEAVSEAAVGEVKQRVIAEGLQIVSEKPFLDFIEKAVSFVTTDGHVIEVHTPIPGDQAARHSGPGIHPERLDHVNLTSENPEVLAGELQRVLGMRLSERAEAYESAFLGAADNRHHTIALSRNPVSGLHHYSWELEDFNDFKRLGDIFDVEGRTLIWGPGRHGAGDNIFAYHVDGAGLMVECSSEMKIIDGVNFQTQIFNGENPKIANRWGPMPPLEWIHHSSPNVAL